MQWLFLTILVPYMYLIIKIYQNLIKIKPYHPEINPDISVSILVACRNEAENLPSLLSDIADQTYNPDLFELIIIDDNSSDSTSEVASGFSRIKNLKVLKNTGKGKKKAVRTGVEASEGRLIVTTDADCRISENWLKTIVSFYADNRSEMLICPVKFESGRGFFERFQELEFLSLQGITAGTAASGNPVMCNGANLVFLKEAYFENAGNLHDELKSGDDVFLLHSIKSNPGKKIMWLESEEATVTTRISKTLCSFLNQRARWISKAGTYSDSYTQVLAIVTFVTISVQFILLAGGLFFPELLWPFAVFLTLKSIPDFLILLNTTRRYGKKKLMKWFPPSQLIYPVYVFVIVLYSFSHKVRDSF